MQNVTLIRCKPQPMNFVSCERKVAQTNDYSGTLIPLTDKDGQYKWVEY